MLTTRQPGSLAGALPSFLVAAIVLAGCGGDVAPAQTLPAAVEPLEPAVTLTARDIAFDATEVHVAANRPFRILLENRDAVPHNLSIDRAGSSLGGAAGRVFDGAVFSGPATRWYEVAALAPGEYVFLCQVHPTMTGRLVVG